MYKICVFAGTSDGRRLIEFLMRQPCEVTACVATGYGQALLPQSKHLTVRAGRLTGEEIASLLRKERFDLVIDATHPYAAAVTDAIASACMKTKTDSLRLLRGESSTADDAVFVSGTDEAAAFLDRTDDRILLTTGSKELSHYAGIHDFAKRVWARVLPVEASLAACREAGLSSAHILAMQGPFSEEMNTAMLKSTGALWLVTKDGGDEGGFSAKARAAKQAGARLLVVGRPAQREGESLSGVIDALCKRFGFLPSPHVTVAGIGPGSERTMTQEVREAIEEADCLIGARRMLDAAALPGQLRLEAIAPDAIVSQIALHPECARFCVLMSGDVGFFSGAKKLLPLLSEYETRVCPGLSSLVTLCARLGESYEDVVPVSLHGQEQDLAAQVRRHAKVFALVGGKNSMAALCERLIKAGLGEVRIGVGERLSYPDERITRGTAKELAAQSFDPLSVVLIQNPSPDLSVTQGLPDECFLRELTPGHVVPMTKSEVRSVCLSKLLLTQNAVCWDVGAGTGSVSVEMALLACKGQVFAIEKNENALSLLQKNRERFSLANLTIVPGEAPAVCESLPAPTHVFLGGTSGNLKEILSLVLAKNPHARIVATAVTLESIAELSDCIREFSDAESVFLTVSRAETAGRYHLLRGQNPVLIASMQNRGEKR